MAMQRKDHQEMCPLMANMQRSVRWQTWPRCKKKPEQSDGVRFVLCPCHFREVQGNVRRRFHETFPAEWLLAEGGGRRQAWKIVTMATSLLVQSGSAVLPLEYTFIYPPTGAAWAAMDRFIPSSRQPQHWSRNYHGSQERRRSIGRQRGSPDSQEKDVSSYRQGVTLRAEDLLVESEHKLGSGNRISPANHITHIPGDGRRALLGGSATELAQSSNRVRTVRRSSEGNYARRRKSSSSSSNAADDPTSSDPSSSCSTTTSSTSSSSSSSESGCNADSETCNYCRLSESSEARESSTDDDRTPPKLNGDCRRLTRAHSEDCTPPSKPIRRTSPGEYLRHKRDQMERLRGLEQPMHRSSFQRCDSDPRLSTLTGIREQQQPAGSPSRRRTLNFASPTRNRIRRGGRRKTAAITDPEDMPTAATDISPFKDLPAAAQQQQPVEVDRPKRSALAKNVAERRSRSKERRSSVVSWNSNNDDSATPFLGRRASSSFRCAVCDCDIPFTNCVLCNAEAKGALEQDSPQEIFINESDLLSLASEDFAAAGEHVWKVAARTEEAHSENKELEDFYDRPTPVEPPSLPAVQTPAVGKRTQWTSKGDSHKSLNHEEHQRSNSARRSSLRKYNSEPVPETEDFQYSREPSETGTPSSQHSNEALEHKGESSASTSSKSESRAGYHVAKDSPRKDTLQQKENKGSCHYCGQAAEDETNPEVSSKPDPENSQRKSPVFLKPQFDFEPEIIHKANPLIDEADVDVLPSAVGAFRRLSEEEFISTLNIHESAKKGDLHVVKLLTKKDPKQMETVDERGWTPIHLAAAHGHTEVVKFLALEGAHLAALDPSSYTAIHLASMNGHNPCLEVLLPLGVDVDSVTSEGFTALHLAVMNCHLECIQTLLQWGASLDKRDALGRSINDMVEEYNLQEVAAVLRRYHKQLHNFKHMLDIMNMEGKSTLEMPREFMDILASIAEESGTE